MKVRKLEKKEYIAVAASLILVTAVGLGLSVDKPVEPQAEVPQNNTVVAEMAKDEVKPVTINKNETAKAEEPQTKTAQADDVDVTDTAPVAQAEAEEPAAQSYDDEFEQAGMLANEITMEWPLTGEIAMDYSADTMVYDPTLDQYRTNDTVCILADEGAAVKAACDGTVTAVTNDYEKGYTVVINHQDGWSTTYSQLSENVAVAVGDAVEKGQQIGQVAQPTKYGAAIGTHLEFKVCQGEFAIDPKVALGE
ncbi:MAG: peptidoglycan DD-metalloendopeptidase family protein [Anaerotignaceae bacterium]